MSEENIVEFKKPDDPNVRRAVADNVVLGGTINLPGGATLDVTPAGLGFTDIEAALNMRDWLTRACEEKRAKVVGSGIGLGQVDIDIELEGCRFNVSMRPL